MSKFCKNCGAQLAPDGKFCASCGSAVPAPQSVAQPVSVASAAKKQGVLLKKTLISVIAAALVLESCCLCFGIREKTK
ncbi:MAG: zinc-ribbon domain-containing protein [Bacillota bacterium]